MRNLTRLAATVFVGVCCCLPGQAQLQLAQNEDITRLIANPSFESTEFTSLGVYPGDEDKGYSKGSGGQRNQPEGWTLEAIFCNWNDAQPVNADGLDGTFKNASDGTRFFNTWSNSYVSSSIYQSIADLPAGAYKLSADMRQTGGVDQLYNQHVYGVNSDGLTFNSSYLSAKGSGPADENWENLEVIVIMKNPGSLTLGATGAGPLPDGKPQDGSRGWFQCDNFHLIYLGGGDEYMVQYWGALMEEAYGSLINYQSQYVSSKIYKAIEDAMAYKEENESSQDVDLLESLVDSLNRTIALAAENVIATQKLENLVNEVATYEPNPYDQAALEVLKGVRDKAYDYYDNTTATTPDGNLIDTKDVNDMTAELKTAIRTYRFTEPASTTQPADFTWALLTPNFTKEGGDPSNSSDAYTEGWVTNNDPATHVQYRLNTINGKNCWNNWNDKFTSMDIHQDLEGMPAGIYTFSCYQTNDGVEMTDQHAYVTATSGTSVSPVATYTYYTDTSEGRVNFGTSAQWEGPLETSKILVGTDGKLRVGFASTSNGNGSSGWFCITDCKLTYYGIDGSAYTEAIDELIKKAKATIEEEMLIVDNQDLQKAITAAEEVKTSTDVPTLEAAMKTLAEAVDTANVRIKQLATFKAGSYEKALAIVEGTSEESYIPEIVELMEKPVLEITAALEEPTTTVAMFPEFNVRLENYFSFISTYKTCEEYANSEYCPQSCIDLFTGILSSQITAVKNNENMIDNAKNIFSTSVSFAKSYNTAELIAQDETYPETARAQLMTILTEQLGIVTADYSMFTEAKKIINSEMKLTTIAGFEEGEEKDVTIWITNSDIEQTHNAHNQAPNGWTCSNKGTNGNFTKDPSGDTYFEAWGSNPSAIEFNYNQTITEMPAGYYRLEAMARNIQSKHPNGETVLYGISNKGEWQTEIFNHAVVTGDTIEVDAENNPVLDENGKYIYKNIDDATFDPYTVNEILVTYGELTLGVKSIKPMRSNWFAADNFKLYLTKLVDATGVEEVNSGNNELVAYAKNGYIIVEGADEYTITTLDGVEVSAKAQLAPGVYIVKSGNQTTKIIVE